MDQQKSSPYRVAVIGGGPAGLMAAEIMAQNGLAVTMFDRMPSLGRKLLMAGRGGLNITHSEPMARFLPRYGEEADWVAPWLAAFPPEAVRDWCAGLGQPTFVGSSGRVFPTSMKASPLLRAWIRRLEGLGVRMVTRAEWTGWVPGQVRFADGTVHDADAVVLALGGASWPRLGTDGGWTAILPDVGIAPLRPANCGFKVAWSAHFAERFAGTPLKRIVLSCGDRSVPGEVMITKDGVEGGAIYALSARARELIARGGGAELHIDLRPDLSEDMLTARLAGSVRESLSNHLRKRAGLSPVAIGLVREARQAGSTSSLAALIKSLPLRLVAPGSLARAISTAGGIRREELDEHLMLRGHPGLFAAGEMLDWEAPTGGYLLQACLASGRAAAQGVLAWQAQKEAAAF
ncbi:MAG TPA: TIGR03862 family flavoprotein [Acidocella sp.]|uniref:NAD(P)/FAD-dependent oxidoreductase n=1 Tax=Acidocella sp. TaxID=50710 RepID=UPI002CDA6E5C|nr:TIGR03862 family flavoprotein [Acidocella sp.]HVE21177.1 TIGR03862 family flavoprotein [Acidocella sp.]